MRIRFDLVFVEKFKKKNIIHSVALLITTTPYRYMQGDLVFTCHIKKRFGYALIFVTFKGETVSSQKVYDLNVKS